MIKQLCTPSFVLYSLGWVLFMLIAFYVVIEVLGLSLVDLPARRLRRELDLHLLVQHGAAGMARQRRRRVHVPLPRDWHPGARRAVVHRVGGALVALLLDVPAEDLHQGVEG